MSDYLSKSTLKASNLAHPKSLVSIAFSKLSFRLFSAITYNCFVSVILSSIYLILSKTSSLLVGKRYFLAAKLSQILLILLTNASPESTMIMNAARGTESPSVYEGMLNVYRIELPFDALKTTLVNL